jgi:predicted RNA-binding protein
MRPEIVRYRKRLEERYLPPREAKILILLPLSSKRPFHKTREVKSLIRKIRQKFPEKHALFHICIYVAPFGIIPLELDEVYPLSQHETAEPFDIESMDYVAEQVKNYIAASSYNKALLVENSIWKGKISTVCKRIKRKDLSITVLGVKETLNDKVLDIIVETLQKLTV